MLGSRSSTRSERVIEQLDEAPPYKHDAHRFVQRAFEQDEYMEYYEEADKLRGGQIRITPSHAPLCAEHTNGPVRALEEAPDGYRCLDWAGQGLTELPDIPTCFLNARSVFFNDNKLGEIPRSLRALSLLCKLRIDANSIEELPNYIGEFGALREVKASDNAITIVPRTIGKCVHLKTLDLQRNVMKKLPNEIGLCTNLEKLLLSKNRMVQLPATLSGLVSLKILKADTNHLRELGFSCRPLTSLTQLRLGQNKLLSLPPDIGTATNLTWLTVEFNQLANLPSSLCKPALSFLRVDGNPLERPPNDVVAKGEKAVIRFLQRLDEAETTWMLALGNSNLHHLPIPMRPTATDWEVNTWARVVNMNLQNNKLVSLPVQIGFMTNLQILDVQYNQVSSCPHIAAVANPMTRLGTHKAHGDTSLR